MMRQNTGRKTFLSLFLKVQATAFLSLFLLTGCLPGSKAPHLVDQYTLEYPPPRKTGSTPFPSSVKVDRFGVHQEYNSTAMIYRPGSYRLASYGNSRWRVNPGDMVTDYLVRDLRSSGMFLGVFSYRDVPEARFAVQGGVEEFLEVDEGGSGRAVLALSIALIDTREKEITKRLVFQKNYRVAEALREQSSVALAQGMSAALKNASEQVLKDISGSMQRLGER